MRRHSSSGLKPHGSPLVDLSRDAECDVSSGHCSSTYAGGGACSMCTMWMCMRDTLAIPGCSSLAQWTDRCACIVV